MTGEIKEMPGVKRRISFICAAGVFIVVVLPSGGRRVYVDHDAVRAATWAADLEQRFGWPIDTFRFEGTEARPILETVARIIEDGRYERPPE